VDVFVCFIFMVDFLTCFIRAPDKKRYFFTWGWIDLVSSIPTIGFLRWGRAARVARILRVFRGVRSTRTVASFFFRRRAEGTFLSAVMISLLVTVFASVAILHFERSLGGNITTAQDALWWSFVTITTVGYGDTFPISSEGRLLAAALMTIGVGLFGTFTAFVASWFMSPAEKDQDRELEAIRSELRELRRLVEEREQRHDNVDGHSD
jgi:voltage-gated potassium channel